MMVLVGWRALKCRDVARPMPPAAPVMRIVVLVVVIVSY